MAVLITLAVIIAWATHSRKRARAARQADTDPVDERNEPVLIEQHKTERQRKAEAERRQAAADEEFLVEQIDRLYAMLWEADADLDRAKKTCNYDDAQNRIHGSAITEAVVKKHRAERDKLYKRVMQLERSIHSFEAKLNKCRFILSE